MTRISWQFAAACLLSLFYETNCSSSVQSLIDVNSNVDVSIEQEEKDTLEQQQIEDAECGIWFAPSTIPGAGLGVFAGRDFDRKEVLFPSGESVIALIDLPCHSEDWTKDESDLLNEYTWAGTTTLGAGDGRCQVNIFCAGLFAAINGFPPIINVDEEVNADKDTAGIHRSLHPSAGSFSPYHNRIATARVPISRGQELFADYGDHWFEGRSHLGPIPLKHGFDEAQILIDAYKSLRNKVGDSLASNVWKVFVKNTTYLESRVIGAFYHDDLDEMDILAKTNASISELRKQQSTRSLSWLKQHGTCSDHLVPRPSKLFPHAGRGAFAARSLPNGTVVSQLPMIHVPNRSIFEMYNFAILTAKNEELWPNKDSGRLGFQLLLNYCYGHNQSSLLLCPYGSITNYVNHNQTLANVKLQWGRPETGNHRPEMLQQPISALTETRSVKLAMELIATRDIKEGEEVFLDYGDEWEQAWQEHIDNWKPVQGAELYKSASDLNADVNVRLPSVFDQMDYKADPFPPNVELKCDAQFFHSYADQRIKYFMNRTIYSHTPDYQPCIILRSEEMEGGNYLYTVHSFKESRDEFGSTYHEAKENIGVMSLPRMALRFFDMAYTDDTFLPNAFRHDIRIPDEIFPEPWKNLMKVNEIEQVSASVSEERRKCIGD